MKRLDRWIILKGLLLLAVSAFFLYSVKAPNAQPSCLKSETLRVEIGGEKFAFPRKIITTLSGPDVKNIDPKNNGAATPDEACQTPSDPIWHVDEAYVDLYPKPCTSDQPKCDNQIFVYIADLAARSRSTGLDVYPKTKAELLKKCRPPIHPFNEWHAKYWDACDYIFQDKGLFISMRFRGGNGVFPPEKIEETQDIVMKKLRQYYIK